MSCTSAARNASAGGTPVQRWASTWAATAAWTLRVQWVRNTSDVAPMPSPSLSRVRLSAAVMTASSPSIVTACWRVSMRRRRA